LRLSEDAACNRIDAARACRRFPEILDLLASGELSLASVRMLRPCLTPENHEAVLARARGRSRQDVLALVAELAPRPEVPSTVRKLPTARPTPSAAPSPAPTLIAPPDPTVAAPNPSTGAASEGPARILTPLAPLRRPIVEPTSPDRYRVQFTIGKDGHDKLRRLQDLLRREIPSGDPGAIVDRALTLLLEKVEKQKRGGPTRRATPVKPARLRSIRPGADNSRNIPREVQRAVCQRDGDRCAFVSKDGHRCTERTFLEFHHIVPHALGGRATVDNISLRCRRHNQYEAELVFGPGGASVVRERVAAGWPDRRDAFREVATESGHRTHIGLRPSAAIPRRGASGAP
jgi:5-methylcytosine-specific restriction endonuclease McrA